jgi:Transposase DDE domain group 1
VSNVPGDPQVLYDDVYCQRGEMENRIKEQQLDLFADRTSCHRFLANQFRLLWVDSRKVAMACRSR